MIRAEPVLGQMTIEECIAEAEAEVFRLSWPVPPSYVEPCPDCHLGEHAWCDGKTLDHALDEFVPCPCRSAGHPPRSTP